MFGKFLIYIYINDEFQGIWELLFILEIIVQNVEIVLKWLIVKDTWEKGIVLFLGWWIEIKVFISILWNWHINLFDYIKLWKLIWKLALRKECWETSFHGMVLG